MVVRVCVETSPVQTLSLPKRTLKEKSVHLGERTVLKRPGLLGEPSSTGGKGVVLSEADCWTIEGEFWMKSDNFTGKS